MVVCIQPDEGIALEFAAKRPGPAVALSSVSMDFAYRSYFVMAPRTGYETLIYDCMIGDAILFQRADNLAAGWQAIQPTLDVWAASGSAALRESVCTAVRVSVVPQSCKHKQRQELHVY